MFKQAQFCLLFFFFTIACANDEIRLEVGEKISEVLESHDHLVKQAHKVEILSEEVSESKKTLNDHSFFVEGLKPLALELTNKRKIEEEAGCTNDEWEALGRAEEIHVSTRISRAENERFFEKTLLIEGPCLSLGDLDLEQLLLEHSIEVIVIAAQHFQMDRDEILKTEGRDLVIHAEKVEIDGVIDTQPKKPKSFSNGKDAGNLFIKSLIVDIGPDAFFKLDGGEAFSSPEPVSPREYFENSQRRDALVHDLLSQRKKVVFSLNSEGQVSSSSSDVIDANLRALYQRKINPFKNEILARGSLEQKKRGLSEVSSYALSLKYFDSLKLETKILRKQIFESDLTGGRSGRISISTNSEVDKEALNTSFHLPGVKSLRNQEHHPIDLLDGAFMINLASSSENTLKIPLHELVEVEEICFWGKKMIRPVLGSKRDDMNAFLDDEPILQCIPPEEPIFFELAFHQPLSVRPSLLSKVEFFSIDSIEENNSFRSPESETKGRDYEKLLRNLDSTPLQDWAAENDVYKEFQFFR